MSTRPSPAPETLDAWRPKATQALLWAGLVADLPALVVAVRRDAAPGLRAAYLAGYVTLAALALWPRLDHRIRAGTIIAIAYALAVVGLVRLGLEGAGRTFAFGLPFIGFLLVGRRFGRLCVAVTLLLYAGFTVAAFLGVLPDAPFLPVGEAWLAQGFFLLVVLLPLAVLLESALTFQENALTRVKIASEKLAAIAEERRRLEAEVIEVSERERRAVGHELHDGLCQQLTAGLLSARLLERDLAGKQAPEAAQAGALAEIIDTALADARSLARGLSPGPLPSGGLVVALRELARQVRETAEVDCEVLGPGAPSVAGTEATQLFRIAQEATQNAVKHAAAERIEIELVEDEVEVRLAICDDGKGLPSLASPGLGMRSMQGRALSIGATLEVGPRAAGGTEVCCRFPTPRPQGSPP